MTQVKKVLIAGAIAAMVAVGLKNYRLKNRKQAKAVLMKATAKVRQEASNVARKAARSGKQKAAAHRNGKRPTAQRAHA